MLTVRGKKTFKNLGQNMSGYLVQVGPEILHFVTEYCCVVQCQRKVKFTDSDGKNIFGK